MTPAAVFFDLDGCLVDSSSAIPTCLNVALVELGLPPQPPEGLRRYIGPPLLEGVAAILAELGADPALAQPCIDLYRAAYVEVSLTDTMVVDGIPAVLDALAPRTHLAVVTSKPTEYAEPIVDAMGLTRHLRAVYGPEADELHETKPDTLARALTAVGVAGRDAVMVGDRHHDIDAGRAHGARTVGVTWGSGTRAELEAAGADHVVDRPASLLDVLTP